MTAKIFRNAFLIGFTVLLACILLFFFIMYSNYQAQAYDILEVEAGTNGYQGGDSGHGGRTYFRIKDEGSTDMNIQTRSDRYGGSEVEVILGGDCELETMIRALKFITKVLEEESREVYD